MMIILPFAMNISMGERTLHELGNPNGKTLQKADGLPSPERSGSPELNTRSSQWKRDCIAYASKEDAHQIDDWPEARNRKSEDVLVRYKDTRGNKGSRTGMDPHAWSDLPTDTDDEIADNATSPVWNGAHDLVFSPKSGTSKAELDISIQQLTTVVPRNLKTQSEVVNLHYFASDDHWETVALDVVSRKEAEISDAENEGAVFEAKLPTTVASSRNGLRYDCHALEGEKIPTLKTIPGRLSQKSLDEQASLKMSHRYYTSGVDSSRRRSIPSRKDPESGIEDNIKHCGRKRCERAEADYKSNVRISTTNEAGSVKELAESSTSDDSSCSDAEFDNSRHGDEDVDGSLREMILQKYLVMLPGKVMKMVRTSADTKQKEGRCKSQSPTEDPPCRKLNGKSLHSVSPSRGQRFQLRKSPKKNPCSSSEALRTRASVSQPAEAPEANIFAAKGAPREEECQTRKSSPFVALLNKSWSTGDLYHSKSLGDIATLKGRPLTHRQMDKSMSEQEKRTVDVQLSSVKDSKAPRSDALQTLASAERSFAMEKTVVQHEETAYPQHTSEGLHNLTNFCIRSVEVSTTATADLPQTKVSDYGVSCGCLNSVLQGSSKTQLNTQLSSAMGEVEYQWQGHMTEQGGESVDGAEGSHCIRENPTAKEQVKLHSKGAEESSDGGSTHRSESKQANCGSGAEKGRNGFTKPRSFVKKVTAVIPFGSCGDDQVLPNVSLAGQPASHARLQLQHEVESSKHHVADERLQQVRNKKHSPPEQCWETEKLAQQKKGFWDASQELQKEKQNLLKRLQDLNVVSFSRLGSHLVRPCCQLPEISDEYALQELITPVTG